MLFFWIFVLVAMLVVYRLGKLSRETVLEDYRLRLYTIRDELRDAALAKRGVDPQSWLFAYVDSSISKTISVLHILTVWRLIGVALTPALTAQFARELETVRAELEKPENAVLHDIHVKWVAYTVEYVTARHYLLWAAVEGVAQLVGGWNHLIQKFQDNARDYFVGSGETSTLRDYAPW